MWRHSVPLIVRGRWEICNWLGVLHKVSKINFYERLSTSLSSMALFRSLEQVWLKIIWFVGSHLDKISQTEWFYENATWLPSTIQNGDSYVRFLGCFGDEFHKENLHFRRWNFGEWLNVVESFLALTKATRFYITFSMNALTPKRSGLISNRTAGHHISNQPIHLSAQNVLYGVLSKQSPLSNLLNYFIIIRKLFLWDWRRSQTLPKIQGLQSKLKIKYETEKKCKQKQLLWKEMGTLSIISIHGCYSWFNMHGMDLLFCCLLF